MQPGLVTNSSAPLIARVYLILGTWKWALSPGLDEDPIQGDPLLSFQFYLSG